MFRLHKQEREHLRLNSRQIGENLVAALTQHGFHEVELEPIRADPVDVPEQRFARMVSTVAIAFQRLAGHEVGWSRYLKPEVGSWHRTLYETLEFQTGATAARFALQVVDAFSKPGGGSMSLTRQLAQAVAKNRKLCQSLVPPRTTREIMRAADKAGVPWIWLDQMPFNLQSHRKRVWRGGGLLLGQGVHRHIVDGTLCRNRSREAVRTSLQKSHGQSGSRAGTGDGQRATLLLVANHSVLAAVDDAGAELPLEQLDTRHVAMALAKSREVNVGLLAMSIHSPASGMGPGEDEQEIDWDLAPQLDSLLPADSKAWPRLMDAMIEWLYPDHAPSRIPVACVTGSNGKTTTTRMIAHITRHAGQFTGMSVGDGIYLQGQRLRSSEELRNPAIKRHLLIANRNVEVAVLECALVALKWGGFPFDHCDVGVLTNVTAEHLQPGWETVQHLAEIKRSVLDRAAKGVVLNADDPNTPDLLPHLAGRRVALISSTRRREAFSARLPSDLQIQLEQGRGGERVVVYAGNQRTDLMAVASIPAAFGGAARFNIENAMQAIAAAWLLGIEPAVIAGAMAGFKMNIRNTPGRLNTTDAQPFKVIIDYVHNSDGLRRIGEFVNALPVEGHRILLLATPVNMIPREVRDAASAAAGHFDRYLCRNYPASGRRTNPDRPAELGRLLERAGVPVGAITVCDDPGPAIDQALGMCRPGDLLVIAAGTHEAQRLWNYVENWRPGMSYEINNQPVDDAPRHRS